MSEKDVFLSKTLSWLLRHSAKDEGLTVSPEGYVPVKQILGHRRLDGKFGFRDLERVVATNAKQRFILKKKSKGNWIIKACQGHSFSIVPAELTPITKPIYDTVVHGAYLNAWPSIRTNGLSRQKRQHIHFAKGTLKDKTVVSGLRSDVHLYIFIDLKKALEDGIKFYESENGVILTEGDEKGFLKPIYFLRVVKVDTGFPPYTQAADLGRTFSKFGNVRVESINARNSFAVLAFTTPEEAKAAIEASEKVNVYGEFLVVRQYSQRDNKLFRDNKQSAPKRDFPKTKQKGVIVEPTEIDLSGDFHQQVDEILGAVRLTQEQATAVSTLYSDLERVLQPLWPGCAAMPFGSITTGLGIQSSDADCFMAVPAMFQPLQHSFVNRAKRELLAHPKLFAEILSIPRANTPIVKFYHLPTRTNCDLSFKTPLGARNSKLIAFLLHADPRLIPMAVVIKYWAKVHGLSGTGRLTNYALTMMIIFYLQQPPMSILPSVEWLQRDPQYEVIVDFWNTGFMDRKELLPPNSNTSSISELLGGFFEYYSTFNFEEMVVCPYLGVPVNKEVFVDITRLPKEFQRYKANVLTKLTSTIRATTAMCVQDPFEQCHNVASAVSSKLASEIKAFFKFAANSYEKEKLNGCQGFLKTILIEKPKIVRSKSHPEYRINIFPKIIAGIKRPDWKAVLRETVFEIFETILKVNLGQVEEKVNPDAKKEKERFTGIITKAIWKRKQFTRLYAMMDMSFREKQTRITEEILTVEKATLKIEFQLTLTYAHDPKSAVVSIKLTNGDLEAFKEFGRFFLAIMHTWLTTLLKPHTKPSPDTPAKIAETIKMIDSNNDELDSDDDSDEDDTAENDVDNESSEEDVSTTGVANDAGIGKSEAPSEAVSAANNKGNDNSNKLAHTIKQTNNTSSDPATTDTQISS